MKSKPILMGVAVVVLLSIVACSPEVKLTQHTLECDDFVENQHISRETEIAVNDKLQVLLCSNPTTGFRWQESAEIGDQTVLEQTDHAYIAPKGEGDRPPAPGTPGREVWTFKALKKGTTQVSMEYSRPWEGGEKAEWTFVLTVVVE